MRSLPKELLNSLSLEENKITSIRINPFKKVVLDFELDEPVKWNKHGFYLNQRPSFTLDPLFQGGCYYVQEAGSMFLEFALNQTLDFGKSLKVLDLCAAPGGKSTLINSLLNEESLLVANEFIKSRADILTQNLSKWGTCNSIVTNNDPIKFTEIPSFFDAIVLDAPCSGSGLFRKQPEAINEWSENNVTLCSNRQQKIIDDVLPCLSEGGYLYYSTCSYSQQENEDIVDWMVNQYDLEYVPLAVNDEWGIVDTSKGYRFYPHLTESEGFFFAVLQKKSASESKRAYKKKINIEASKAENETLTPYLNYTGSQTIIKKNNQFHLVNKLAEDFLTIFEKLFYFKKAGVVIGEIKGKDLVPNQELAWSLYLNSSLNSLALDKETVLKYLRKENFSVVERVKGLTLIKYKTIGIGWSKILENRINNYFPSELRILNKS